MKLQVVIENELLIEENALLKRQAEADKKTIEYLTFKCNELERTYEKYINIINITNDFVELIGRNKGKYGEKIRYKRINKG